MPGLCFSNELISRNEGLHCDFACLLYSKLINKLSESRIVEIVSSAVKIEMEFVVDALPVELIGMNSGMMRNYIRFCADQLLLSLGCGRHYKIGNPFKWMETISLQGKTNIFEKRVGEYSKSGVGIDRADQSFALKPVSEMNGMMKMYSSNIISLKSTTPSTFTSLLYEIEREACRHGGYRKVQ